MTRPEVILINAPVDKLREKHYDQSDVPRIGLAYLAAYLISQKIACNIIDAKFEKLRPEGVLDIVNRENPGIIGFTAMTPEIMDAAKLAVTIKKFNPQIIMVIGGPHATALPRETLEEFSMFDLACIGEGEYVLRDIVESIRTGRALGMIKGIAYRENNEIKVTERAPFITSLDDLPFPAWHLFSPAKTYPVLAARGCPFKCNFCMRAMGEEIRPRSPDLIIREMVEIYDRYQPETFMFYDDTFGVNKSKTDQLLNGLIASGLNKKTKWFVHSRVDVVSEELFIKMKAAGCICVGFGIESGNEKTLKAMHKNITKDRARQAVAAAKKTGLETGTYFIFGHPHETEATIKETIDFALELNTTTASFGIMTPYPGTEIARMIERGEGGYKLLSKNWVDYNKNTGSVLEFENVTVEKVMRYQLIALLKFYFLKFSFAKIRRILGAVDLKSMALIFFQRIFGPMANKLRTK